MLHYRIGASYHKTVRHEYVKEYYYKLDIDGVAKLMIYRNFMPYKSVLREAYKNNPTAKKIWIIDSYSDYYEA